MSPIVERRLQAAWKTASELGDTALLARMRLAFEGDRDPVLVRNLTRTQLERLQDQDSVDQPMILLAGASWVMIEDEDGRDTLEERVSSPDALEDAVALALGDAGELTTAQEDFLERRIQASLTKLTQKLQRAHWIHRRDSK